jgi:hypothetical protein
MNSNEASHVELSRQKTNRLRQSEYIKARILWPAIGYPEVISPKSDISVINGTNCIELLILADKENISRDDIANHLRYVKWKDRHCHYLQNNPCKWSFPSSDIEVNEVKSIDSDDNSEMICFASGWIVANLAKYVREFYKKFDMNYLYRVRISEFVSSKLEEGLYNLFWINRKSTNMFEDISEEINVLLKGFAINRRPDNSGCNSVQPVDDYKYALGYKKISHFKTEVLHPLFVRDAPVEIKIAHLTDTHIACRNDYFGRNLKDKIIKNEIVYNNYNERFKELYYKAKKENDLIIITGDIIDYGRGYRGSMGNDIGNDHSYCLDRNWSLFYSLIAAGETDYKKPLYTLLGNHDWRLNPYGPLNIFHKVNFGMNLTTKQMEKAHGDYYDAVSYGALTDSIHTDHDSVKWYLLLINPFFDYTVQFPGKLTSLMLDWAKEEEIFGDKKFLTGLPIAKHLITKTQKKLIEWVYERQNVVKMLALHPGVIAPWPNMPKDQIMHGLLQPCPYCKGDGRIGSAACHCLKTGVPQNSSEATILPLKAIETPKSPKVKTGDQATPTYGTLKCHRDWLVELICSGKFLVTLSGHAHRNSIFVILEGTKGTGFWKNKPMRVKPHLLPKGTAICIHSAWIPFLGKPHLKPIFVNTSSAGPIGSDLQSINWNKKEKKWEKKWEKVLPGFHEVVIENTGLVKSIKFITTDVKFDSL